MDVIRSLYIVKCLADGVDPNTGEMFARDSPYQHPDTIRALYVAAQVLERSQQKREQHLPGNAGKPWDKAEDKLLCDRFDCGASIKELAQCHLRTLGAVKSRLEKLGKLVPYPVQENQDHYNAADLGMG